MEWDVGKIVPSAYTGELKEPYRICVYGAIRLRGLYRRSLPVCCIHVGEILSSLGVDGQCSVPVEMPWQLRVFRVDTYAKHRPYVKCRSKIRRMYS